jgi:hypothetical protein
MFVLEHSKKLSLLLVIAISSSSILRTSSAAATLVSETTGALNRTTSLYWDSQNLESLPRPLIFECVVEGFGKTCGANRFSSLVSSEARSHFNNSTSNWLARVKDVEAAVLAQSTKRPICSAI